ncbi:MAG: hypothetical protein WCH34_09775 [Bacteroidota bacterium]
MKLIAASLSLYILVLLVFPSFINLKQAEKKAHCQKTCCHISKPCEKKTDNQKEKSCKKGQCTPFFGCSTLQFIIPTTINLTLKPQYTGKHFATYIKADFSTSLSSVWRPPKQS